MHLCLALFLLLLALGIARAGPPSDAIELSLFRGQYGFYGFFSLDISDTAS